MSEATQHSKSKKEAAPEPKFEIPHFETSAAFRDMAETTLSQVKQNYEKMKSAAEDATNLLEGTYSTMSKGATDYGLKLIETARANTNAAFDYAGELFATRSLSEMVEVSTAHARKQFDALQGQVKELTALAQKVATETAEPIKDGITKATKKVA
jgi:phasin